MTIEKTKYGYRARVRLDGKNYYFKGTDKTKVKREAEIFKLQYKQGELKPSTDITLLEAAEKYIADRQHLSPSTLRGYETILRGLAEYHTKPLKSFNFNSYIKAQNCTPKTLKNKITFVSSLFRENGIDIPNYSLPQGKSKEREFLEPDEIAAFLKDLPSELELPVLLGLHSLRRSEIFALTKKDFDFKRNVIHVNKSCLYGTDEIVIANRNKTAASTRDVPIMMPRIRELVQDASDPLFSREPNRYGEALARYSNRVFGKNITFHSLRHSFASLAYHLGMSELETSAIGGWSGDLATMRKIYTHLAEKDRQKSTNKMAAFFSEIEKAPL